VISCDECQEKIVAFLDNESTEEDEALISAHLKDCPQCRAFQRDLIRMGQEFGAIAFPSLPAALGQEVMREAVSDHVPSKKSHAGKGESGQPWPRKFRRLAWASGLIGLSLILLSCLIYLNYLNGAREVAHLRSELQIAERDVALFRAEKQLREVQERQEKEQKAITALYLRMGELEQRFDRAYSPRTAFLPTERGSL